MMNINIKREIIFGIIADFLGISINVLAFTFALMKLENKEQIIGVLLFSMLEIVQIVALIPNAPWKKPIIEGTSKISIALIAILGASFGFLWTTFGAGYLEPSHHLIQAFSYIGLFITLLGQFLCIWGIITLTDVAVTNDKLWNNADPKKAEEVLSFYVENIQEIAYNLQPFLPETAKKILKQFSGQIKSSAPLFPRIV